MSGATATLTLWFDGRWHLWPADSGAAWAFARRVDAIQFAARRGIRLEET